MGGPTAETLRMASRMGEHNEDSHAELSQKDCV